MFAHGSSAGRGAVNGCGETNWELGGPQRVRLPAVCPWPVAVPLDARRVSGVLPHQRAVRVPCSAVQVPLLHGKARVSQLQEGVWPVRPNLKVFSGIPLAANLIGPVADLDAEAVGIENEEGVIAR